MQATACGAAVQEHRAGAADALLATDVRAFELQVVAQEIYQQGVRLDGARVGAPVHLQRDLNSL